jgi:MEMO1 family protein
MRGALVIGLCLTLTASCNKREEACPTEAGAPAAVLPEKSDGEKRFERRGPALAVGKADEAAAAVPEAQEPQAPDTQKMEGQEMTAEEVLKVRSSVLAGTWYASERESLEKSVDDYLDTVRGDAHGGYPIALIAPHAGYRFSGPTAAYAYAQLKGRTYGRVFLIGPSHRTGFSGISVPRGITHYETPLGRVPLDTEVVGRLAEEEYFQHHPTAHMQEHSLEIQLPFLQRVLGDFRLVPMLVSGLGRDGVSKVAEVLRRYVAPGDLVVASSDFTHYGPRFQYTGPQGDQFGPAEAPVRLDALMRDAWTAIGARDVDAFFEHKLKTRDTICGFLPIALVLELLPPESTAHLLHTDTSGRSTGDFHDSVSYLAAVFGGVWPYNQVSGGGTLSGEEKTALLKLARHSVDSWVRTQERSTPATAGIQLTDRMKEDFGAFVTLKTGDRLRGCIGTIVPVKPLYKAVIDNGINAAHFDRRFPKVQPEELEKIGVEVSVLTPPVEIDDYRGIILGKHGVIIEKSGHSAVFLPQVAPEQGWTLADTLSHLSRKAGLGHDGWREGAEFKVFEALVFHEE